MWRARGERRGVERRSAAAKSRYRRRMASNLRTQSPVDGRHLGLWISRDLHGRAVKATSAAPTTTERMREQRRSTNRGGDRGARGSVVRHVEKALSVEPGSNKPPTPFAIRLAEADRSVVKRSVPQPAQGESRATGKLGIHGARVLVVENVLGGRSRFGRILIRAIAGSRKASRGARASRKEAAIR